MNAETKKKLMAILFPALGILVMGFILFYDGEEDSTSENQTNDINVNVAGVTKNDDVDLDSKTDVYNNKKDKDRFNVPKDKYVSSDDFFNVDTQTEDDFFNVEEETTEEPIIEEVKEEPKKVEQKVIVKHIYHNSSPSTHSNKNVAKSSTNSSNNSNSNHSNNSSREPRRRTRDGFYQAHQEDGEDLFSKKFIKAYVHNDHSIKSGEKIEFITNEDCVIAGQKIPENSLLVGVSSLQGDRMKVTINSVKVNNNIHSCNISVFDNADALEGIFLYGSVNQDLGNDAVTQAGQQGVNINVPMVGNISTGALKKAKDPVVQIPSKTKVLIKLK